MLELLKKKTSNTEQSFEKTMWYQHRQSLKRIKRLEHSVNELLLHLEEERPSSRNRDRSKGTLSNESK